MNNKLDERDFVGFLSILYIKRRIFYIIFILMMSMAVILNTYYNKAYQFTIELKTPYTLFYAEVSNYFNFLDDVKSRLYENTSNLNINNSDNERSIGATMSAQSSFNMIYDLTFDTDNIKNIADQYVKSPHYDGVHTSKDLIPMIDAAISIKVLPGDKSLLLTITSNNEGLVEFLHDMLPSFLNGIVRNTYKEYINVFEQAKIDEVQFISGSRQDNIYTQLTFINEQIEEVNSIGFSNKEALSMDSNIELNLLLQEKIELTDKLAKLKSYVVPLKDDLTSSANFFLMKVNKPILQTKINILFVFTFFGFISFILYLVFIIGLDLQEQVRARIESSN